MTTIQLEKNERENNFRRAENEKCFLESILQATLIGMCTHPLDHAKSRQRWTDSTSTTKVLTAMLVVTTSTMLRNQLVRRGETLFFDVGPLVKAQVFLPSGRVLLLPFLSAEFL